MGAPTGSIEVRMATLPRETAWSGESPRKPVMVTVAALDTECRFIACHVTGSGVQECAAANCGVSLGGSLVSATQSGSIFPMRRRSPLDVTRIVAAPLPKETSIRHKVTPFPRSRQRNVGAVFSDLIDLSYAQALTLGRHTNSGRAIAKRDFDPPQGNAFSAIAPKERRGRVFRSDRSFLCAGAHPWTSHE